MEETDTAKPLTDEQIWGVPAEEMPDAESCEPDDDFCTIHGTHCQFWHATLGCLQDGCIYQ